MSYDVDEGELSRARELTSALGSHVQPWPHLRRLLLDRGVDPTGAALLSLQGHRGDWLLLSKDGRVAVFHWDFGPAGTSARLSNWRVSRAQDQPSYLDTIRMLRGLIQDG